MTKSANKPSKPIKSICVFCASSKGKSDVYQEQARQLGYAMAEAGIELVYGGGHVGLMGIVADAVLERGGRVTGVIPQAIVDLEVAHHGLTRLEIVRTMHERKKLMFDLSDAFISLPGGYGTLDETFEIITWKQLQIHHKPVILLNSNGYYDAMIEFIDRALGDGLVRAEYRDLFAVAKTPEEALGLVTG